MITAASSNQAMKRSSDFQYGLIRRHVSRRKVKRADMNGSSGNNQELRIRESKAVVEFWNWKAMDLTSPPQACTSVAPTIFSIGQSPPFTRISGRQDTISDNGVSVSNQVTTLTLSSAATTASLSSSAFTGRSGPFPRRLTEESEFSARIRLAPNARDSAR